MLNLADRKWSAFKVSDIFNVATGANIKSSSLSDGSIPRITAKDITNGISMFTTDSRQANFRTNKNCVSVSFLGSVFYQPYRASFDMKIHSLTIKDRPLNQYIGLFIVTECKKQFSKYAYGNQLSSTDLPKQKILLPLAADGVTPDWQFMETYMRQKEQEILEPTIHKLCKRLIINHITGGGKCIYPRWKTFVIGDLFNAKRPSNNRKEDDYSNGKIPFVASGGIDNGVTKFCTPKEGEVLDKGACLSVSPVDGSCYYQPFDFLGRGGAGSSVILLYAKGFSLDKYTALFLSKAIAQTTATKYSYGRMASLDRLKKDKVYLPVTEAGAIDFAFMSSFMQDVERDILGTTLKHFKARADVKGTKSGGGKMASV